MTSAEKDVYMEEDNSIVEESGNYEHAEVDGEDDKDNNDSGSGS